MKHAKSTHGIAGRAAAALFALSACGGVISAASAATPAGDAPSVTVRYAPREVSSEAGAKRLYQRIANAARQVCPDDARDLSRLSVARACQHTAIERAVRAVNSPHLAAAFEAATKRG